MTNVSKEVIYKGRKFWDIAKLVRHQILTLESVGSSPTIPAKIYWNREYASSKLAGAIAPNSRDKSPKSRGFYRSQVGKAPDSDSGDHRFESCHSSQTIRSVEKICGFLFCKFLEEIKVYLPLDLPFPNAC